jgi:general nucleoside transport system ATP-binding protein
MADHIHVDRVSKSFGTFVALDGVSLRVPKGVIQAVLGENGAGKTTLMNILYGLYHPDGGRVLIEGQPVSLRAPADAIRHGIGMIHQHFQLVSSLTVTENIVLGLEEQGLRLQLREHERRVRDLAEAFGFEVDPAAPVWRLPMGMRQRVEILKALYRRAGILILDEPTSVLTPKEIDGFLAALRRLRDAGHTILFVTHKLEEVLQAADRVAIMRQGRLVAETEPERTTAAELARLMVGRDVVLRLERRRGKPGRPVLEARELHARNDRNLPALDGLSFEVGQGEILGVTGVDGNGQVELGEVIAGLRPLEAGTITVAGREINRLDVRARRHQAGIGFVPEDRQTTGLVLDYPVAQNLVLRSFYLPPAARHGLLDFAYIRGRAEALVRRYDVRLRSIQQPARLLSGGNQQKLILAREIESDPRVLVVMQACKGLDVGAIEFVQNTLLEARARGVAILYISTELDHVLEVADRVAVMYRGSISGILAPQDATAERLGLLMAGATAGAA